MVVRIIITSVEKAQMKQILKKIITNSYGVSKKPG